MEDGVRGTETQNVETKVSEEEVAVVSREIETENNKEMGTERRKKVGAGNSREGRVW